MPDSVNSTAPNLSKREHYAGLAMQSILAGQHHTDVPSSYILNQLGLPEDTKYDYNLHFPQYVALMAFRHADAMLLHH